MKITDAVPIERIHEIIAEGVHPDTARSLQAIADEHRSMASEIASSRQALMHLQHAVQEDPLLRIATAVEAIAKEVHELRVVVDGLASTKDKST